MYVCSSNFKILESQVTWYSENHHIFKFLSAAVHSTVALQSSQ